MVICVVKCSLRTLLHKSTALAPGSRANPDGEELQAAGEVVRALLTESLAKLENDKGISASIRWELGACWVQHLQSQAATAKSDAKDKDSKEQKEGKESKEQTVKAATSKESVSKITSNGDVEMTDADSCKEAASGVDDSGSKENAGKAEVDDAEAEAELRSKLSEAAFARLKESDTDLHRKVRQADPAVASAHFATCPSVALSSRLADLGYALGWE